MITFADDDAVRLQYRAKFLAKESRIERSFDSISYAKNLQEQSKLYYAAVRALLNIESQS